MAVWICCPASATTSVDVSINLALDIHDAHDIQ